jgi:hypothetical protein
VADDDPDGIETVVMALPDEVAENLAVPAEFEPKVTVSAVVVGLPKASCSWTVSGPKVALAEAVPERGVEVMTNFDGAPALMVSTWVPLVSAPETVMVGEPALVSP